jgi:hypothetical protein
MASSISTKSQTEVFYQTLSVSTIKDPLRDRVLELVRDKLPLEMIFNPSLHLDLRTFLQDQVLIHKLVSHFFASEHPQALSVHELILHFEALAEFNQFFSSFKNDPEAYKALFCQSCQEMVKSDAKLPHSLESVLQGRIFTLKNALVAMRMPEAILESLKKKKLPLLSTEVIKAYGATYIKSLLHLHFEHLKRAVNPDFRQTLNHVCRQLMPFVNAVTSLYLKESGKGEISAISQFRNPTGYNYHGHTGACVMEACLRALGYETFLIARCDLNPRVTLATAHSLVAIEDPKGGRYLVDVAYGQFLEDVYLDPMIGPKLPVLVLEVGEVEAFVDEVLMKPWQTSFKLISSDDVAEIRKAQRQEKEILYMADRMLPKDVHPDSMPVFAKKSLVKIWDYTTYHFVFSHINRDEIFHQGVRQIAPLVALPNLIGHMGFSDLIDYRSHIDIQGQLTEMMKQKEVALDKILPLIAQLPRNQRAPFLKLLDCDDRLMQSEAKLDLIINAYLCSLRKLINPEGKNLKVVYGCSGADCTSVFLATDAQEVTFADLTPVSLEHMKQALEQFSCTDKLYPSMEVLMKFQQTQFTASRSRLAGSSSYFTNGKHFMPDLPLKIMFELKEMGVDLSSVALKVKEGDVILSFDWSYKGASKERRRSITFTQCDITRPETYSKVLREKLEQKIDIFYLKGAFFAPRYYDRFLPDIARHVKAGGYLMTADKTMDMEAFNPEICLDGSFKLQTTEEIGLLQALLEHPFDALASVPNLDMQPHRLNRGPGSDFTYWLQLNIRQKKDKIGSE